MKVVQWLNPIVAGAVIGTGSWQSEQQRTTQVLPGVLKRLVGSRALAVPAVGAVAAGALASRRRKASGAGSTGRQPQQLPPVVWHTEPSAQPQPVAVTNLSAANGGATTTTAP